MWVPRSGPNSSGFYAYDINNFGYVAGKGDGPRLAPIIWSTRYDPLNPSSRPSMYLVWPRNQVAIDSFLQAIADANALPEHQRIAARNLAIQVLRNSAMVLLYGAHAINDEYQVVGYGTFSTGSHAFVLRGRSGIQDLGALPNSSNSTSEASAIGEGGEVVGSSVNANGRTHAFYWDQLMGGAQLRDLGSLSTGATDSSRAHAVNRWGVVVGESGVPGGRHAFRWDPTSGLQNLGDLPGGAAQSIAYAIRDGFEPNGSPARGDIVGRGTIAIGPGVVADGMRAVGWPGPASPGMPNGAPIDLNTRIVPPAPNVTLIEAKGINNLGIISAKGVSQGIAHVYILVPWEADMPGVTGVTPYQDRCLGPFTQ
jgi:probable HAF family extracellular repeat protein